TTTVTLGELFTAGSYTIQDVTVTGGTYTKGATWDKGTVTVTGTGTFTITITDNYYCNTASATLTVAAADPIDKFTGTTVTKQLVYNKNDTTTVTFTLGDLFDAVSGASINSANVTVTAPGATIAKAANWEDTTLTYTAAGTYTVTVNDQYLCNDESATATVTAAAKVDKWTGKTVNKTIAYGSTTVTATLDELFTDNGYTKGTISVGGATYANGVVTFNGAGTYKVTITDNTTYCNTATATVNVSEPTTVAKFTAKNATVTYKPTYPTVTKSYTLGNLFNYVSNYALGTTVYYTVDGTEKTVASGSWSGTSVGNLAIGEHTITITDKNFCSIATVKVTIQTPDNVAKFTAKNATVTYKPTYPAVTKSYTLGELFNYNSSYTLGSKVYYKVDSNAEQNVASGSWSGTSVGNLAIGTHTITITDKTYCNTATVTVTIQKPDSVTKWTGKAPVKTWTLDNYGTTQSFNFAEMFTKVGTYPEGTITLTITSNPNNGASVSGTTVNVTKAGTYTVTAIDNSGYCNVATATIKVNNPTPVTKWTAKSGLAYEIDAGASQTLKLSDIFTLNNNYKVGTVTYTVEEQSTKTVSGTAWANTTVTFPEGGTYTVTITDDHFSDGTYSATVSITELEPVRKFKAKDNYFVFQHSTVDPSASTTKKVSLGDIFAATGEGTINSATVTVTSSDTSKATVSVNTSDWTKSEVTFKGVTKDNDITLTITDNKGCMVSKAIIGVTPQWLGDVDGDDYSPDLAQAHYHDNLADGDEKQKNSIPYLYMAAGGEPKTFTVNVKNDGVYGIQWYNVGDAGTKGDAIFTANGYSVASTVPGGRTWSDAVGTDFVLYLEQGDNTITVENNGSAAFAVYQQFNTMPLNKPGYDSMDFMPLVKDLTASTIDPDTGEQGGGTVTPPSTPDDDLPPIPSTTISYWNGAYTNVGRDYSTQYYPNGTKTYYGETNLAQPSFATGTVRDVTVNAPYTGVYAFQMLVTNHPGDPIFEVYTDEGYYYTITCVAENWTSANNNDGLLFLREGTNTVHIKMTGGSTSATVAQFDLGYFIESGDYSSMAFYNLVNKR
ncbi:MAG: hypothetical protein J6A61_04785, partial [Clostridia bacterium]|nr:hypothetical protein [Clostridia bacterium]